MNELNVFLASITLPVLYYFWTFPPLFFKKQKISITVLHFSIDEKKDVVFMSGVFSDRTEYKAMAYRLYSERDILNFTQKKLEGICGTKIHVGPLPKYAKPEIFIEREALKEWIAIDMLQKFNTLMTAEI